MKPLVAILMELLFFRYYFFSANLEFLHYNWLCFELGISSELSRGLNHILKDVMTIGV